MRDEPQDAVPQGVTDEQWIRAKAMEAAASMPPPSPYSNAETMVDRARRFERYIKTGA